MAARRDVWVRALLPALLAAHQRKSSVHQKFLSLLITTLEKVHFGEAGRDQTELHGPPPPAPTLDRSAVTVTVLTDDLELLDFRSLQLPPGHRVHMIDSKLYLSILAICNGDTGERIRRAIETQTEIGAGRQALQLVLRDFDHEAVKLRQQALAAAMALPPATSVATPKSAR